MSESELLKEIAERILLLTYRDLKELARMIAPNSGSDELADQLVDVAETILRKGDDAAG